MQPDQHPVAGELHLFILWEKARSQEDRILSAIQADFEILAFREIVWDRKNFAKNLTRFYGKKLPDNSSKEREVGNGPFLLVIVRDSAPVYELRRTSKGPRLVNINLFDAKMRFRELTSASAHLDSTVHATNDVREARQDIVLLTGQTYRHWLSRDTDDASACPREEREVLGLGGWNSIYKLFFVLNESLPYVILRNFEHIDREIVSAEHCDIDLLVSDFHQARSVIGARKVFGEKHRVHTAAKVGGREIFFDLRFVGDNYLPRAWQLLILKNRILYKDNFFIPADEDYFYSLLYHALINKNRIADNYTVVLTRLGRQLKLNWERIATNDKPYLMALLEHFLDRCGESIVEPLDLSVGYKNVKRRYPFRYLRRKVRRLGTRFRRRPIPPNDLGTDLNII
jgi:hypothetical protein